MNDVPVVILDSGTAIPCRLRRLDIYIAQREMRRADREPPPCDSCAHDDRITALTHTGRPHTWAYTALRCLGKTVSRLESRRKISRIEDKD